MHYVELVDLLMDHLGSMAEHNFMASWNYVQYREVRRNITVRDVIFVHNFAQNWLCQHQNEVQGLYWKHMQVTVKVFTQKSIQVLKSNNVNICKIIEFTDQAPSQYKNRTAFNHLANAKIPTLVSDMEKAPVMHVLGG